MSRTQGKPSPKRSIGSPVIYSVRKNQFRKRIAGFLLFVVVSQSKRSTPGVANRIAIPARETHSARLTPFLFKRGTSCAAHPKEMRTEESMIENAAVVLQKVAVKDLNHATSKAKVANPVKKTSIKY